ncbi:MAG: tetratricopeptide repeat protein [Clostridiaceae bacterium]|nr:tetratricopeptide repeat protein [Clostridiaceae bacterium]
MNKKIALTLSIILAFTTLAGFTADTATNKKVSLDKTTVYYPNASLKSSIAKYKRGNYTGCLQELFSLTKKHPSNAAAYYYMGLAYTRIGEKDEAIKAYNKAISINANSTVTNYAKRGRDCLTGGPLCHPKPVVKPTTPAAPQSDLDKFINAPYGNGLSPEVNQQIKQQQLQRVQQEINNTNGNVNGTQLERIKDIDSKGAITGGAAKITGAEGQVAKGKPSDKEVMDAIDTLKRAGLTINVSDLTPSQNAQDPTASTASTTSKTAATSPKIDPNIAERNAEYAQIEMLLGNNNNNNNNNSMMNMLPYLMNNDGSANKNIDPKVIETMMTSSMMNNFDFNNSNNNNNNY